MTFPLFDSLQNSWDYRLITRNNLAELQIFLDQFQDFFLLCEGVKGSAAELLAACPPTKDSATDKFVLDIYDTDHMIALVDLIQNYPEDFTWTIGYLLVHPHQQSHGIGSKIIQDLEKSLSTQGVLKLRCVVQKQNPAALSFWKKNGFHGVKEGQQILDHQVNQIVILEKIL